MLHAKRDSILWSQLHTIYDAKTNTIISPQLDATFDALVDSVNKINELIYFILE